MDLRRLALTGLLVFFAGLFAADARAAEWKALRMPAPDGGDLLYALLVPDDYQKGQARPLVLALHPGAKQGDYYGLGFARQVVAPGIIGLNAIVIAPDCPTRTWTDPGADKAVMALVEKMLAEYTIDKKKILVTGFSMGGGGTWFMSAQHPDVFTAAIAIAAPVGNQPRERLGKIPTYVIHGGGDEVVPFGPAEENAMALQKMGKPVAFEAAADLSHYTMGAYIPYIRRAMRWVEARW